MLCNRAFAGQIARNISASHLAECCNPDRVTDGTDAQLAGEVDYCKYTRHTGTVEKEQAGKAYLYTSTAQGPAPAGKVPRARAMYTSITRYDTATVTESEAVSRASSSSTERSEEKARRRWASDAMSDRLVRASWMNLASQASAAGLHHHTNDLTAQHSTAQHSTAQHSAAQHSIHFTCHSRVLQPDVVLGITHEVGLGLLSTNSHAALVLVCKRNRLVAVTLMKHLLAVGYKLSSRLTTAR